MLQLEGPYELSVESVEHTVPRGVPGVYLLGYVDPSGTFRVQHVGRNDVDVRKRLRELIGSSTRFKFAGLANTRDAFEQECALFHKFKPRGVISHPQRPAGSDWKCPVCFQLHFG
ncbi:MAG: hypothetical protein ACKVP7_05165 [Hyphomicrobiaceae bacterium]